jgi:hypothetical protein
MLTDVIGIVVAFVSVILLLSILVTSLVQFSQAVLRLRARNLMKGITALVLNARSEGEAPSREEIRRAKYDATNILNATNIALINHVADPTSKLHYWLLGPKVSWIEAGDLPEAIREQARDLEKSAVQIQQNFQRIQRSMQKRFLLVTRLWTFAWALLVAVLFQVSAPGLLSDLAEDAERREFILSGVDEDLAHAKEATARPNYENAAEEALQALQSHYPDQRERIEEASGVGVSREFIVAELALVLEGVPQRAEILNRYEELLNEAAVRQIEKASAEAERTLHRLAQFDIRVWPDENFYYYREQIQWKAIIGVLFTAILLSLGAPFWYERLRDAVRLRDMLASGSLPSSKSHKPADTPATDSEGQSNGDRQNK